MGHQPPADVIAAAQVAQNQTRVPACVSIAQWAVESGWGAHTPPGSNNPFGVKDFHGADAVWAWTTEVVHGVMQHVKQPFKRYASLNDAFAGHAELLAGDHRYAPAMAALPDIAAFVKLMAPVYATAPNYGEMIMDVITDSDLIYEVASSFGWSKPSSAILLTGWVALAPICGALHWRPNIWITGGAGSGKSTVLNDFVNYLMNGYAIYAQGNSTEAGIRQTLKWDALPVLFDESEQNNEREAMRVQQIIALIRQSSTESAARTLKGTQGGAAMDFMIRSMFCLSSIQVWAHYPELKAAT
jgi:hypothetical protein